MPSTRRILAASAAIITLAKGLQIGQDEVFQTDDLFSYVTMPHLKAPRFNVKVNHPELVSPGFWFVAPYTSVEPRDPAEDYKPYQIGPMIYDATGELVWSGANLFMDRSVFDFRTTRINDTACLSFITNYNPHGNLFRSGSAVVLDPSYQVYRQLQIPEETFNMHEFNVIDGKTALLIESRITMTGWFPGGENKKLAENGFKEVDLQYGTHLFEWNGMDHLRLEDSQMLRPYVSDDTWDYLHLNSVDKSKVNGDYIVSSRYMDTIYRISGQDGSIVWQFGGKNNSFEMPLTLRFIAQHDARIVDEYNSTVILSFLNNGADDSRRTQLWSQGHIVALNTDTMTVEVLRSYVRPDNGTTHGRGNIQVLPNGNVFANWADNAYISEHTPEGEVIYEAQFSSKRYVTYRAYKFEFEGRPVEKPALAARASVTADAKLATEFYVSWNGATHVRTWKFYSCRDDACEKKTLIGSTPRNGFETSFTGAGLHRTVFAEAVAADGKSLGQSALYNVTLSVLPAVESAGTYAEYDAMVPRLLVLSFFGMVMTIAWVFYQRRKNFVPSFAWKDPEKQSLWSTR